MQQHRLANGSVSGRRQQTALKQTVDRTKTKSSFPTRNHPYFPPPLTHQENSWLKTATKIEDDLPELELTCQEETLSESQLQHYPTQAYDPTAPLPSPAIRKRTTMMKKMSNQDLEILRDADEDFIPSESDDDDDDDDENYLPEHDRRPYHRTSHTNGRGRGGRGQVSSTTTRLGPSTHFVRPQPQSRSQFYSQHRRNNDSLALDLERTYASSLTRFYGTRNGQTINEEDYSTFRIKCSICDEHSANNISFVAHLCSHFEDDLNYVSPFDKTFRRCSACHEEFSTPFQTFLHKDQVHMLESEEFRCRICHENHPTLMDLFSHLNSNHIGLDMPYQCDRCYYRTSMYEDMAQHIRQMHKGTQYFFCPYCFQSVSLPTISYTTVLNSAPAFRHVIHHFDRIENSNKQGQQQRRIESLFKYCHRCVLHVKSLAEHNQYHHPSNSNSNEEENHIRTSNDHIYQYRSYPPKFDRTKQLPMATIRRRPTITTQYEQIPNNNRWYSRR